MTEPTPDPTGAELDQAISDAGKALTAALLARPRNQASIDAARAELNRLRALRDAPA
jgi:hypothetical protein